MAHALACLADPPTLAAIGLLLFNDHVLKAAVPSWLTGKLSDVAGLYFFPFLVLAVLGLLKLALPPCFHSPKRTMGTALALSGLWFLALKATSVSNTYAVALLDAAFGPYHHVVADPTDLIALAMLPLAWRRWKVIIQRCESQSPDRDPRGMRWFRFAALALASLASLATEPPREIRPPVSFGCAFDVADDPESGDTLYASLATYRVTKWEGPESSTSSEEINAAIESIEAEYTIETYRSQDGGRTWALYAPVGGYLWTDPHTPDRLYVLNEGGLHLVEGGQARLLDVPFEALHVQLLDDYSPNPNAFPGSHSLAFDPLTPGVLYLTDGGRILTSDDGGETWGRLAADGAPARLVALAVAPSAPRTLYAAAVEQGRGGSWVLRSDNGGDTWSRTSQLAGTPHLRALAVHPQTSEIVYAAGEGVYRSVDGGATWQSVHGAGLRNVALHPTHPNLIYAAGPWGVIFSNDGGDTWVSPESQSGWDVAISPAAPHRATLALCSKGVAVQASLTTTMVTPPPTPTPPLGLAASDEPTIVYADALAFDPRNPTVFYTLVNDPPALGRSDDGGASWAVQPLTGTVADPPVALTARLVSPAFPLSPTLSVSPTGATASLVAVGGRMAYSLTWRADSVEVERFELPESGAVKGTRPLLAAPSHPRLLLTTGPGGVLRSDDGGQSWTAHVLSPTESISQPTALAMGSVLQSITVYATADTQEGDAREQIIFRSDDGGLTWKPRSRLTETHRLTALAVHPADPNIVYGSGAGLYQSGDGGATWTLLYPEMAMRALAIAPGDPRLLYAITDAGVARSDDGGMTWTALCPIGGFNGPAEFLDIAVAPVESFDSALDRPYPVVLLAHPIRPDVSQPSVGACHGLVGPHYDLRQGWQQFSEGLPVFVKAYGG